MSAIDILKHHDIKVTPVRRAMIAALQTATYPLSENDIKEQMPELYDRVTFYRNFQLLTAAGVIHKIVADSNAVRYALNCCDNGHQHTAGHAHFFCETCQRIVCLNQIRIPVYNLPEGYTLHDCDIVIKGICKECNV